MWYVFGDKLNVFDFECGMMVCLFDVVVYVGIVFDGCYLF